MAIDRADAYKFWYNYLNVITIPQGILDFEANIPDREMKILAPTAQLAVRADLHPALIDLLLQAACSGEEILPTLKDARNQFESDYLSRVIMRTGGNISEAAKLAGKYRSDLYKLLRKHDIDPKEYRKNER